MTVYQLSRFSNTASLEKPLMFHDQGFFAFWTTVTWSYLKRPNRRDEPGYPIYFQIDRFKGCINLFFA